MACSKATFAAAALALGAVLSGASPGDSLKIADIGSLKKLIKPYPEESKWEEIPWRADLWDARREAAKAGKPLMLWEMDGNPMGCG